MFKFTRITFSSLLVIVVLMGCGNAQTTSTQPQVSAPYLGQDPPGMEPEIFAPGIVSDPNLNLMEWSGTFSPDGSEYYFYRYYENLQLGRILFSKYVDGKWTTPEPLAFLGDEGASLPHLTLDNERLYFNWRHPVPPGQPGFPAYFFVERTTNGWTEPSYAGQGMYLSSSRDGQIYTTDMSQYGVGKTFLAKVTVVNGVFTNFERLTIQTRLGNQAHPCIAPDGSYLLFDVNGGEYLYVSFKKSDGTWGEPIDLTKHGFDPLAGGAYVSPDGRYLFFALRGDIWWVDIQVIENLRPEN